MKKSYPFPSQNPMRIIIYSMLLLTSLSLSSCFSGRELANQKISSLQNSYDALLKERNALLEENRKLRNDNQLLSKALKEQTIEEDLPAED